MLPVKTKPVENKALRYFRQGLVVSRFIPAYTRLVRRSYELRFWMLAVLLCLATSARATAHTSLTANPDDRTFVLPLDPQYATAKAEVSLAYAHADGVEVRGWEVSVFVDAKHCKLYCKFHHKASADPLLDASLPPIATIRLFNTNGPFETVLVLDPAGSSLPKVSAERALQPKFAAVLSRPYSAPPTFDRGRRSPDVTRVRTAALSFDFDPPVAAPIPLRI